MKNTNQITFRIALLTGALAISGCASQRDFYAVSGSRADGTVDMAYDIKGPFDVPEVDRAQAAMIAKKKCNVWGYDDAEPFGGQSERCNQRNGFGNCINGQIVIQFQCLGSLGVHAAAPTQHAADQQQSPAPRPAASIGKWQYQAEQAALNAACAKPSLVNSGAGVEVYNLNCASRTATMRCEFGNCTVNR